MVDASDPRLTSLLDILADEMEQGNLSLQLFDGARFARHAWRESRICGEIEDLLDKGGDGIPLPSRLKAIHHSRQRLLQSTQRTVRALWGVHSATSATYQPPQLGAH
jgi:hypothetical protein